MLLFAFSASDGESLGAAALTQGARAMAADRSVVASRVFISVLHQLVFRRNLDRIELSALIRRRGGRERQVASLARDIVLSLATHDVAQEFLYAGIAEGLGDLAVGVVDRVVDVDGTMQRVGAIGDAR